MRLQPPFPLLAVLVAWPAVAEAQAEAPPPICADRPAKANATCTVLTGRVQLETGLVSWSLSKADGARTTVTQVGGTVVKLGLSDRSDLQLAVVPYVSLGVQSAGRTHRVSGIGDVIIRYKHRLTGPVAPVQLAVIPFVKLPTASRPFGNRRVEGGLAVPISIDAGRSVSVALGPELDLLADSDGSGRHLQLINLVNLSAPLAPRLTGAGELWTATNFDPAGTMTTSSVDLALAYALRRTVQIDVGANLGLTRQTPRAELFAGASWRF